MPYIKNDALCSNSNPPNLSNFESKIHRWPFIRAHNKSIKQILVAIPVQKKRLTASYIRKRKTQNCIRLHTDWANRRIGDSYGTDIALATRKAEGNLHE